MTPLNPDNFILIGGVGVGKSSLLNALLNRNDEIVKTPTLVFHPQNTIDTPGEYFDNPRLYTALISTMSAVDTVLYVHQSNAFEHKLPPGLFRIYNPTVIGVISKIDLPDARVDRVCSILQQFGIGQNMFPVSIFHQNTINRLRDFLVTMSSQTKS
ncbi:EutP/PduV family microcompartment system protein [candidate division CSSED10-310 bacterium]|uniref:EutP/PduV family microcompartment system protein n=1 Tax=candidate division CSSED10-310 bacterium TaxID=2855610 RepID=A0ABV6YV06_UNCC1